MVSPFPRSGKGLGVYGDVLAAAHSPPGPLSPAKRRGKEGEDRTEDGSGSAKSRPKSLSLVIGRKNSYPRMQLENTGNFQMYAGGRGPRPLTPWPPLSRKKKRGKEGEDRTEDGRWKGLVPAQGAQPGDR